MRARLVLDSRYLVAVLAMVALAAAPPAAARADDAPIREARAILADFRDDPGRLRHAQALLEEATRTDPPPDALVLLARTWFLIGQLLARTDDERLAAFDRGREAARQAIDLAPGRADAHVQFAINTGLWAQTRGLVRAAFLLSTLREQADIILRLDPNSVEGQALAGGLAAQVPRALGGNNRRAEEHFLRAIEIDPRRSAIRVELARFYIARRRNADARYQLTRALQEPSPTDASYWWLKVEPEARALLASLRAP